MKLKHNILLCAVILFLGVFGLSAFVSSPVFARPVNGKVMFVTDKDGNYEIYTMNADGSNQARLTNNASQDSEPVWSPDGSKIVFNSLRDGNFELYAMNSDGTNQVRLTNNIGSDSGPSWTPDSTKLAIQTFRSGNFEIYTMNADGSNQTNLTNNAASDSEPVWSPDGSKIVFYSFRNGNNEIYTMNNDGTNQTRLTSNSTADVDPVWSPDGTKIAFQSFRDGNLELYVMNADGTNQTNVTNNPASDYYPAWSPDGTKLLFNSNLGGTYELYTINADGTNQTQLTNTSSDDEDEMLWSPDGLKIVYERYNSGYSEEHINIMDSDGSNKIQLTNYPGKYSSTPSIQPIPIGTTVNNPGGRITTTVSPAQNYPTIDFTLFSTETLILNGSLCDVIVPSGGILQGTGTACTITVEPGGTVSPGQSPGCLISGDLSLSGTYVAELAGTTPCSGYDQLQVTGTVSVGGTLSVSLLNGFAPAAGNVFTLIANDATDPVTGTFIGLAEGATITIGTTNFIISYAGGTGNDVTLTATATSSLPGLPATGDMVAGFTTPLLLAVTGGVAIASGLWIIRKRSVRVL